MKILKRFEISDFDHILIIFPKILLSEHYTSSKIHIRREFCVFKLLLKL
eukprot:UN09043